MTTTSVPVPPAQEIPREEPPTLGSTVRAYTDKVRGGDVGSLPAILGLVALVIVFSALRPAQFTNAFNFANLINQSAAVIVIAMGLVFILLLGEIDLAAGYTAGTAAAVMGIVVTQQGQPWWLAVLGCLAAAGDDPAGVIRVLTGRNKVTTGTNVLG